MRAFRIGFSYMATTMIRRLTARDMRLSSFRYYDLLVHVFVVILLISNLVGQKICTIPFIHFFGHVPRVSGAQLLFPITYIFGDIFTEVYGYGASRRAIWIGFFANILLTLVGVFVVWFPAAPEWKNPRLCRRARPRRARAQHAGGRHGHRFCHPDHCGR